jgi:hypothetical protein
MGSYDTCKICPTGSYCLGNTTNPLPCPTGSYCPIGTRFGTEYLCPNGTYSNYTSLTAITGCTPCTPGYYCVSPGLVEPTAECLAGYYCSGGSSVPTPFYSGLEYSVGYRISYVGETCVQVANETLNDVCPPGHYCPQGSPAPRQCPPGTNSTSRGLTKVSSCPACSKGYYCPLNGTVYATRLCVAGYYCPAGTANPTNHSHLLCPVGHECPTGSAEPTPCAAGTYQNEIGQAACKACPSGYYCLTNTTAPTPCVPGHYCPASTRFATEYPCLNGSYSISFYLKTAEDCTPCTPGHYCGSPGLSTPTAVCSQGYYCGGGSESAKPYDSGYEIAVPYGINYVGDTCANISSTALNDICPPGHYCPEASSAPTMCPPGTNSTSRGLTKRSDCPACSKGYYCPHNGTIHAVQKCVPGYYCPAGTDNPSNRTSLLCPVGHECPTGSDVPMPCPAGSYQDEIGKAGCKECTAGSYCVIGSITPVICPVHKFCPSGSPIGQYCANGTYGIDTGLVSQANCTDCLPGMYCSEGRVSGACRYE